MKLVESIMNNLKEAEEPIDKKEEAIKRMEMVNLDRRCINAFKSGNVWKSEAMGSLFELNEKEKEMVKEFEDEYKGLVYHIIYSETEFGTLYAMLYVSNHPEEWEMDNEDLKEGYPIAYVENISDPYSSEFGSIGIRPANGGLVRTA